MRLMKKSADLTSHPVGIGRLDSPVEEVVHTTSYTSPTYLILEKLTKMVDMTSYTSPTYLIL